MRNILKGLVIVGIFGLGLMLGASKPVKEIKIEKTLTQSSPRENVYLEDGETFIELSDGSWIIYGNGNYIFQPVELGDWDYQVENEQQLENLVKTYISIKNTGKY